MRKLIVIMLALAMLLTGCSLGGVSQEDYDALQADYDELKEEFEELEEDYKELQKSYNRLAGVPEAGDAPAMEAPAVEAPTAAFDEEAVLSQLVVTQMDLHDDWSSYTFLEVQNQSEYTINININVKFYSEDGTLVGASDGYIDACEPGAYALASCYSSDEFSWAEYELSVYEETYYRSVTGSLSWESTTGSDKEIVTIYNNGDETAQGVMVQMLFYNGDELVGYSTAYESEIKVGKSSTMELYCYETYDNYIIYYSGYVY